MQINSVPEYVLGSAETVEDMGRQSALPVFSGEACRFLETVSAILMKSGEAREYPDVMTFAFWCRKAALRQMARCYAGEGLRLGRGIAFHIAPSNVAVNFAYSMAVSLLAGNGSIVRLPSREFPQTGVLCRAMGDALGEATKMKAYLVLVRYGHEKDITDALSRMADIRVLWGGDRTVEEIRNSPMKPRAREITFADRYSLAVICGDAYLGAEDKERIARDFYNDTYLTDQNACTSPRLVIWLGRNTKEARKLFWEKIREMVERERYNLQPVQAVDKLTRLCLLGAERKARWRRGRDNLIVRAEVESLDETVMERQGNSGFFLEYVAGRLEEILPVCGERCQTLACFGVERAMLVDFVARYRPRGVERIVPLGRTMDFSPVWDGTDLIRAMSREVAVL